MTKKSITTYYGRIYYLLLITLYKIQNISIYLPMQDTKIYFKF